ncbi:AsnC family transcriptional regulator [Roseovarius atlanticus]|uniref:AsnC family transcriptional regulator n=1 Tax=Roseovarius atlanticus TaxID=1641875 RepID=A0A0T5NWB9_9RHOB|nr:Lrp/AsnC family transcriptional regulator [Roseovarius atlanticus]KRS13224.1 AsnC family transcriptional regulator [Roseovarius atlanticus]
MTRLDARDIEILKVLAEDGRITKAALADRVGLSASPCWERLKRLEKAGLISGYRAEIALRELGPHVTVFVAVELTDHTAATFRIFEDAVLHHPEIVACWGIGGGYDYLLQVVTADINSYQRLVDQMLNDRIGMARYFSYVVTKPVKGLTPPPLDVILGQK